MGRYVIVVVHGIKTDISIVQKWAISLGGRLISSEYKNMLSKLEWECLKGHQFKTTFNHIKNRGQWCPVCGRDKINKNIANMMKDQKIREKISKGHLKRNGFKNQQERLEKRALNKKARFLYRLKTDPQVRLKHNIRTRLSAVVKGKRFSISTNMGCTWLELKIHLESKFLSGMTWDNYGYKGWHIDHIKPLSLFDLTDKEQFTKACNYNNLQPLWAKDNFIKGAKYV